MRPSLSCPLGVCTDTMSRMLSLVLSSKCEVEIAEYTGHKYCVALNSCGSAIMLMMKCAGLQPGDEVLSNAFTFGAVPSAIEHAGGKVRCVLSPVISEHLCVLRHGFSVCLFIIHSLTSSTLVISLMRLYHNRPSTWNLTTTTSLTLMILKRSSLNTPTASSCSSLTCVESLLIWMPSKTPVIATMLSSSRIALTLLVLNGRETHSGHVGKVAAISAQSYKMINSGEGGFLLTDDAEIAAKCAVYAGAYEGLASKHTTVPGPEVFADLPNQIPNYSLRMSAVSAAIIRPQVLTLDERREKYNKRYAFRYRAVG